MSTPKPVAPVAIEVRLPCAPLPPAVDAAISAAVSQSWSDGYRRGAAAGIAAAEAAKPKPMTPERLAQLRREAAMVRGDRER